MEKHTFSFLVLLVLIIGISLAGCVPQDPSGPCEFTGNIPLTVYRLPDDSSDVFGVLPAGETHEILARTADGWLGFDPGVAQAGNIGLAHHRWVFMNITVSPSCLSTVDLVTLADVQADLALSNQDSSILTGLVFDDDNADGVLDPGEPGFAGVALVLESGPCLAPVSVVSELTASDGTYQFEILPPTAGTYCLSIDPLNPPNDTILIPGGFTVPIGGKIEITLSEGEDISDILFGWDFQFAGTNIQPLPNPVITNVVLSTTTPPDGGWVEVEVTIENQGDYPAEGYELVLIPHYGWGPPNPAGYVVLPTLMPGVPRTEVFSPGVLYSPAGTYTLRVLVTDDWYATGNPDSTGTNGDYQDFTITVTEAMSFCNPFENMDISVVLLSVPADTLVLPLYLKIPGGVPGMEGSELWDYRALLGEIESYRCGLQGFPDRLYCMFNLPPEALGLALDLKLFIGNCEDPAYYQPKVTIPLPQCNADLDEEACKVAGGTWKRPATGGDYYCDCP
jgi:hypothetical protein